MYYNLMSKLIFLKNLNINLHAQNSDKSKESDAKNSSVHLEDLDSIEFIVMKDI